MSDFEFVFALFGLLLGLSLAEVLGGLARAIQWRLPAGSTVRIGWLTPLLAAFVILDLLSFWQAAWNARTVITVTRLTLMAITIFAGSYYLAASLVFPREVAGMADLDDHFLRVRKVVVGVLLILLFCQLGWYLSMPAMALRIAQPLPLAMTAILIALMTAAMFVRGERWCRLVMIALVARYLVVYLL